MCTIPEYQTHHFGVVPTLLHQLGYRRWCGDGVTMVTVTLGMLYPWSCVCAVVVMVGGGGGYCLFNYHFWWDFLALY